MATRRDRCVRQRVRQPGDDAGWCAPYLEISNGFGWPVARLCLDGHGEETADKARAIVLATLRDLLPGVKLSVREVTP